MLGIGDAHRGARGGAHARARSRRWCCASTARAGSTPASDDIWREVARCARRSRSSSSMSDLAASGGYYIAAGADQHRRTAGDGHRLDRGLRRQAQLARPLPQARPQRRDARARAPRRDDVAVHGLHARGSGKLFTSSSRTRLSHLPRSRRPKAAASTAARSTRSARDASGAASRRWERGLVDTLGGLEHRVPGGARRGGTHRRGYRGRAAAQAVEHSLLERALGRVRRDEDPRLRARSRASCAPGGAVADAVRSLAARLPGAAPGALDADAVLSTIRWRYARAPPSSALKVRM